MMNTYSYEGTNKFWQPREEAICANTAQPNAVYTEEELMDDELPLAEKWNVKRVLCLLRLYGAHRCLWDVHDFDNNNRKIRKAALIDIAAAMDMDLTVKQIVHKINVLRSTYRYEKRRIKQRIRRGLGVRTKLKWFPLADAFLRHVPRRAVKSRKKAADSDSDLDDSIVFKIEAETLVSLKHEKKPNKINNLSINAAWLHDETLQFVKLLQCHSEVLCNNGYKKLQAVQAIAANLRQPIEFVSEQIHLFRRLYAAESLKQSMNANYKSEYCWWPMAEHIMQQLQTKATDNVEENCENFVAVNELPPPTPMMKDDNGYAKIICNSSEVNLLEGKWSLKYSIKFLRLYGAHHCLWDLNDPDYRSREMRAAAIEDIATAMGYGLDADFVAKKIKIFRITYMQHRKRMLAAQKQSKQPKIQLLWFPLADSFLRKHIGLRSISAAEPEIPQFEYQDVVTNLNLIDPGLLTQFRGTGTQNSIDIGFTNANEFDYKID